MTKTELEKSLKLIGGIDERYNFKAGVSYVVANYLMTLSEIEESIDFSPKYKPKNFQIIRDYHNGIKKIIAKEYPPVSKGRKRNRKTFKKYDRKLYNSITRSKQAVYELARCNEWSYFVTLTINKNKFDRSDLKTFMKAFTKWLGNYSDRKLAKGKRITYLLIPEIGQRGAWHLHGLIKGIPRRHLSLFVEGQHPQRLIDKGWLNWGAYAEKFGFCCLDKIKGSERAVRYSTKKITKSYTTQMRGYGERLYYCSKGLKRATEIERGYNLVPVVDFDFENEWVGIKWIYE